MFYDPENTVYISLHELSAPPYSLHLSSLIQYQYLALRVLKLICPQKVTCKEDGHDGIEISLSVIFLYDLCRVMELPYHNVSGHTQVIVKQSFLSHSWTHYAWLHPVIQWCTYGIHLWAVLWHSWTQLATHLSLFCGPCHHPAPQSWLRPMMLPSASWMPVHAHMSMSSR